ncbi:N-acetyltransferase [Demequina sp. NBRC 110054]|uniref:GNAT family N-acetyltransferase n=1 Tax=Demequina sp. NBRC 110054 TaxID=1570343 RepID=UPI001356655A|nr:N-acetyltransferase [Demequina sp. NBRC 110054]
MVQQRMRIRMQASLADVAASAPTPPSHRPGSMDDLEWQSELAWEVYPRRHPFASWEAVEALNAEMRAGEWGELVPEASPVAETDDGRVRGFVATIRRVPKFDLPDCPYVINVITAPEFRRQGIAAGLLGAAAAALLADGEIEIALTVDDDNPSAIALYESLGFTEIGRVPA